MSDSHRILIPVAALLLLVGVAGGCHGGHEATAPAPRTADRPNEGTVIERDAVRDAPLAIEDLIRGRAPGVTVIRNGNRFQVRIRGTSSFSGGTNALVVIDGIGQPSPDALAYVHPADVLKIEVLKDASAAIYGVRGQNGVLVITTRRSNQ